MAFDPKFKANHKFYIFYSQQNPKRSVISEFQVSANKPDEADINSERIIMEIPGPIGITMGDNWFSGRTDIYILLWETAAWRMTRTISVRA